MKSISLKKTINLGNYENISVEITIDRLSGQSLENFLNKAKSQLKATIVKMENI